MIYLVPFDSTFIIYQDKAYIPSEQLSSVIEIDSLPDGFGELRRNEDGEFYYYLPEPEPEPTPEPELDPSFSSQDMQSQILINTELLLLYKELGI